MPGFSFKTSGDYESEDGYRQALTDGESRTLMLCAERGDLVVVTSLEEKFIEGRDIPDEFTVRQRANTYYGPKLLMYTNGGSEYLITAPGPDTQLYLWVENTNERGKRITWMKLAEITACLHSDVNRYHHCPQCNEPLKSAEHEKLAAIGQCPNL